MGRRQPLVLAPQAGQSKTRSGLAATKVQAGSCLPTSPPHLEGLLPADSMCPASETGMPCPSPLCGARSSPVICARAAVAAATVQEEMLAPAAAPGSGRATTPLLLLFPHEEALEEAR